MITSWSLLVFFPSMLFYLLANPQEPWRTIYYLQVPMWILLDIIFISMLHSSRLKVCRILNIHSLLKDLK